MGRAKRDPVAAAETDPMIDGVSAVFTNRPCFRRRIPGLLCTARALNAAARFQESQPSPASTRCRDRFRHCAASS